MPADTSYADAWKLVENYVEKQRPQSALEVVNGIYAKAKREKHTVNFIKAVAYKLRLQQEVKEDDVVSLIADLRKEADAASFPEKNILHAYLAKAYLGYYNSKSYLISQRTPIVSDTLPADITLWDADAFKLSIFGEIDKSLSEPKTLKGTPIEKYRDLFTSFQKGPEIITPTLFDGLAINALDIYRQLGRSRTFRFPSSVTDEADEDLLTEGLFAPAVDFTKIRITGDSSTSRRALRLYQDLLVFHQNTGNTAALIDYDLSRLAYVSSVVHTEEGDSSYVRALESLYSRYKDKEEAAQIVSRLIDLIRNSDPKKAHGVAEEVLKRHPRAPFAPNVRNLKRDLERPEISMVIEHSIQPGKPTIGLVRYKNVQKVWLRIVEFNGELPNIEQEKFFQQLKRIKPTKEWEQPLPDFKDLRYHSGDIKISSIDKHGRYFLLASTDPAFTGNEQAYGIQPFWVTKLTLAKFESSEDDEDRYFVHDPISGSPIAGATVKVYTMQYNYQTSRSEKNLQKTVKTDAQGKFSVVNKRGLNRGKDDREYYEGKNYVFEIITESDRYISDQTYSYPQPRPVDKFTPQTFFFTDRSIYRPGQTIYFKGIMIENNPAKLDNNVVSNRRTTVKFLDANYQLIAEKEFTTNEYGSFNGTFTAPIGKLNGQMHIEDGHGNAYFRVEEYKRPTFNVTFEDITKTYKVDDSVIVNGNVKSFAGANLDGARIRYRVTRVARFPYWFDWWRPIPYGKTLTITGGTTTTSPDGTFTIGFIAKPDKTQPKSNDPLFTYEITADVIDISGETLSGSTTVSAAYYSLISSVAVPEIIERSSGGKVVIRTNNVNGRPASSRNDMRIERLTEPTYPIRKRLWEKADTTTIPADEFKKDFPLDEHRNESDLNTWPAAEQTLARAINLDTSGVDSISLAGYKPGVYKVTFITHDPAGKDLRQVAFFKVYDKQSPTPSFVTPLTLSSEKNSYQPGSTASIVLSSSYEDVIVFYEVTSHRGTIRSEQIRLGKAQRTIEIPVTEQDRGGITVTAYLIHDYRLYSSTVRLEVPWTNKDLTVKIETFRSKLKPGEKDEWRITLKGLKAEPIAAEMLAAMYDASLDEIEPHRWNRFAWSPFFPNMSVIGLSLAPREIPFVLDQQDERYEDNFDYGRYMLQMFGLEYLYQGFRRDMLIFKNGGAIGRTSGLSEAQESVSGDYVVANTAPPAPAGSGKMKDGEADDKSPVSAATTKKLDQVSARKNFNETAFFYPTLLANDKGEVTFSFTVPEALTTWKMMGYAHTADLKTGYVEQKIITQKELMVQPNAPRFLREGDSVVLVAKISNISSSDLSGDARLSLFDATTMLPYDAQVSLTGAAKQFSAAKGRSTSVSWRFVVPEGAPTLVYRIVAASGNFSDGEEAPIPVLPNKMLVTETLPLNVRGKSTETYRFEKLAASKSSPTLRNHKLTLEMSSNPAWYAIQALPMLMEYPYDCAEQIFNRFYANSIAFTLANSNPRIKRVFDSWKGSKESLLSNLEKNEDLKQVLLEETPWVMSGKNETERKQRLGIIFDINTMSQGLQNALNKLQEQQTPTGAWSWFPGMRESDHITQYIVAGFGKLQVMGVDLKSSSQMIESSIRYIDLAMDRRYRELKRLTKDKDMDSDHLGYDAIQYLYARSFYTKEKVDNQYQTAFNYWIKQAEKYWTNKSIIAQSMIGIALHRFDKPKAPKEIVTSLKERALRSKELGMYWKYTYGWFWYELPIETQATAIELFDEVAKDKEAVEELKIWLLKNKQVNDWKTTTATSDACYALLGRGSDLLASSELVKIELGGNNIDPKKLPNVTVEEGTGYFRTSWHGEEIRPEMANVKLTKVDDGIAWGAVYWQYFERLDKITPAKTPLVVEKKLYRKNTVAKKAQLEEITPNTPIRVGDVVTARIAVRVDRDMEYIHLKDMRGASFEPVSQLSGFHYKGGLGYYESIKDASTNFFIHYLPKGVYVLEYDLRASHSGTYLGGITTIQSMYAPEFASHTEGITVSVKE